MVRVAHNPKQTASEYKDKREQSRLLRGSGVTRDVNEQELKSAYRKQALRYHPDRNPGDHAAEERFKQASEATRC